MAAMDLDQVKSGIDRAGFTFRGAYHPLPSDGVPEFAPGIPSATLALVGNAGPQMWSRFVSERNPQTDSLDDWSRARLESLAQALTARAIFPFDLPALPFQRWAQRAESCYPSPLGILIHADYGLWHAYRGALLFAETLPLAPAALGPSPCTSCSARPCLSACPVGAFTETGHDVVACARYLEAANGRGCMKHGCAARRACPVGRRYLYEPQQVQFHMRAFLDARRLSGIV
jgi:hypothetical protein